MKIVPLGQTGLLVSQIGFGGSRIGGIFAGTDGRKQALDVLRRAYDAGVTFYDTADMYAQGESEALIGTAFRECRNRVVIATKGGYCLPAQRKLIACIKPLIRPIAQSLGLKRTHLSSGVSGRLRQEFSPAYLTQAIEASLKRLQTDYIDVYQLHSPGLAFMQSEMFGESLATLERLKSAGKIRSYGIATETHDDAPTSVHVNGIGTLQLGFGLLDLDALAEGTLASAATGGMGVIARGCFGGGLLKDGLDARQLQKLTPKSGRILALHKQSQKAGRPLLETALQFCLATPGVGVTLLGMHSPSHLRDNLRFYYAPALSAEEYEAVQY
jgi:aryl-alcohol dehydrogenase-like predicted oxidoreductase